MSSGLFRNYSRLPVILLVFGMSFVWTGSSLAIDLNPFTFIKDAIEAAVEDRSAGDIATDTRIKASITASIAETMGTGVISINSDVYEQDVMLTGIVETPEQRATAEDITRNIQGIKQIYNEIIIKSDLEQEQGAVEKFVDDTIIETKINAQLLDAKGVNVTNFRYRSIAGHVFLFGRALSSAENDKATEIANGVENVRSVANLAKVRSLLED